MKKQICDSVQELIKGIVNLNDEEIRIKNISLLKEKLDDIVYKAVFGNNEEKDSARWLIKQLAYSLDIVPSSIHNLYTKGMGENKIENWFTVPAINLRGLTYDIAQRIFKLAVENEIGALILEIAKSEIGYTDQRPSEYAACVLAAAIKADYKGPVFLQGDHFQFNAKKYAQDPEKELENIKSLTKEAIEAGFYNIDIDPSTLVDYSKETLKEQQYHNYTNTAKMTAFIREIEPDGITVSIGGEIGHIGGKNSTPEEFKAFMEGYLEELSSYGNYKGISKISVQTGTTHGGVPLPSGEIARVKLDFSVLETIGKIARDEYKMAGAVQHGASTLPDELFHKFPEVKTAEIHLATGFQNIIYDFLPEDFKNDIYKWLESDLKNEWKEEWTREQFIYKTRKKAFGQFKKEFWDLPKNVKEKMLDALEQKFKFLFEQLNVLNTKSTVEKYIKPVKE